MGARSGRDDAMMILGTVGAFGFDDFHPPEVIGLYVQAGCQVVQAYRNRQKAIRPREILAVCNDLGVRVDSLHAHFGDDMDPSSEDETVRRTTVDLYEGEAEYCLELGGDLIVVHPSPPNAPPGNLERRYAQFQRTLQDFAALGEKTGVRFAVENMPGHHPVGADVKRLVDAIVAVGSPHVVFLLDIAHAHLTCGVAEAVGMAGRHVGYTHVCDNDGVGDLHWLPFQGTVPWRACGDALHRVGYEGVFLLEVFHKAEELRRLLTEEWKGKMQALLAGGGEGP